MINWLFWVITQMENFPFFLVNSIAGGAGAMDGYNSTITLLVNETDLLIAKK